MLDAVRFSSAPPGGSELRQTQTRPRRARAPDNRNFFESGSISAVLQVHADPSHRVPHVVGWQEYGVLMSLKPREVIAMARPRMTADTKRSSRISIHWRPGELERVQTAAELLGLPLADFLRMSGLERARTVIDQAGRNPWTTGAPKGE